MARLRRETHISYSDAASIRLRAAWLYYNQGLTQKDVAEKLGVSRSTVIRMLDEAMKRSEVQIWISEGVDACVELAIGLEKAYGLDEAVVVPLRATEVPMRWRAQSASHSAASSPT